MIETMSLEDNEAGVRRQVWLAIGIILAVYGLLRLSLGAIPQDPAYHLLADTRTFLGVIPHAGDMLTNLAILAAGLLGLAWRNRMTVAPEERTAANVLIAATILLATVLTASLVPALRASRVAPVDALREE